MKPTKKQIKKVLRTLDRTQIFKLCAQNGIKERRAIYDFIKANAPTIKVSRLAYHIAYSGKVRIYIPYTPLTVKNAISDMKMFNRNDNYRKELTRGSNNWYWVHPGYGHSDYNKCVAFPINEKNNKLAQLIIKIMSK